MQSGHRGHERGNMSETVETCGKAYCEHYPDGLFVCAKCREESTIAHDKACAQIVEARADADPWKGECNALQRMVHEARAEIERLQTELRQNADSCAETNLEIDWCKACTSRKWCAAGQSLVEAAERGE